MNFTEDDDPGGLIAAYKAQQHTTADDDPGGLIAKYRAATQGHAGKAFVNAPELDKNYETKGEFARGETQAALQGLTGGLGTRAVALTRAALPEAIGGTKGFDYSGALSDEQQSLARFRKLHPKTALGTELVSSLPTMIATGGLGNATRAVGFGAKVAQGAKLGATYGAVQGFGESKENHGLGDFASSTLGGVAKGAVAGAASVPLLAGASKLGGALGVPEAAGWLARKANLDKLGNAFGMRGMANEAIGSRVADDEAAGFTPRPTATGPGAPAPMAIHRAGPSTELTVEKIANREGPGRSVLKSSFDAQSAAMRPGVSEALDAGVGKVDGAQAMSARLERAKSVNDQVFDRARAATEGQPVSPATQQVYDEVVQTPAGKLADSWARVQKANRLRAMPTVEGQPIPAPQGVSPDDWQNVIKNMKSRGMEVPTGEPTQAPDYEHIHFMKQALAKLARIGVQDDPGGLIKASAQGGVGLWSKVQSELPQVWKDADAAAANEFSLTDMMNRGRNVLRTKVNPAGKPRAAIATSLGTFENDVASGTAAEQRAARTGAAGAAQSLWEQTPGSVKSPGRVFSNSPERVRQLGQAFPSPGKANEFQQTIGAWDRAQAQNERLFGNSRTAVRTPTPNDDQALGVLGHVGNMNFSSALKQMFGAAGKSGAKELDAKTGEEIAKLVTSPDFQVLDRAKQIALLRQQVGNLFTRGGALGAGYYANRQQVWK